MFKQRETLAFKIDESKLLHNIIPTYILYWLQGKYFKLLELFAVAVFGSIIHV
jgi:hypothetical protein